MAKLKWHRVSHMVFSVETPNKDENQSQMENIIQTLSIWIATKSHWLVTILIKICLNTETNHWKRTLQEVQNNFFPNLCPCLNWVHILCELSIKQSFLFFYYILLCQYLIRRAGHRSFFLSAGTFYEWVPQQLIRWPLHSQPIWAEF